MEACLHIYSECSSRKLCLPTLSSEQTYGSLLTYELRAQAKHEVPPACVDKKVRDTVLSVVEGLLSNLASEIETAIAFIFPSV